uniref:Major facilitator superfamily (MFS) profile domain-containing protein n=1 Tax=Chromera velia CCMP2878 TaxID=1169474 RepID=A0A0G4I779_9ALVE|mmetsp:Transcript_30008/g.58890  ORF Transcript_30008/g.58890 Transcript_30008/m.58890 type:complete len:688 (-) Transcript_30008:56-2119(-)|eukprot:Cvel_11612.t1-p1 / transcript=Cvel_11612.t1 / gene=Cvel_11612 / organism=Chromera_velia_CCMP2878 / gene_product=Uncharacterized MFS-type transporter YhjX, putative / transcript_product=Uncharacterized MFS-type transporter YhjX, putative / location=Cvel_scaffold735:45766-48678(+) / protein_length=687 / sequence_SO=supercontig / SO=protein_coding / is_pseudo=false
MKTTKGGLDAIPEWRKWIPVLGGMILNTTLGTVYSYGNLAPYFISYMRSFGSTTRYKDASWVYTGTMVGMAFAMPFGGLLESYVGPSWAALIGGMTMSLGVYVSQWSCVCFPGLLMTYGLVMGVGVGLAYACPLVCGLRWMPDRKGLVSGILIASFGLGASIFAGVQTQLVNPHNHSATYAPFEGAPHERYFDDPDVLERVPPFFEKLALIFALMQVTGALLLQNPPSNNAVPPVDSGKEGGRESACPVRKPEVVKRCPFTGRTSGGEIEKASEKTPLVNASSSSKTGGGATESPGFSHVSILGTPHFWRLWLIMFMIGVAVGFITPLWKVLGCRLQVSDFDMSRLGSLLCFCNALGRLLWGRVADVLSPKHTMMILTSLGALMLFTIPFSLSGGFVTYGIWVAGIFSCVGGSYAIFPAWAATIFGHKNLGSNYGMLFTSQAAAVVTSAALTTHLMHRIGIQAMLALVGCACIAALYLSASFYTKRPIPGVPFFSEKPQMVSKEVQADVAAEEKAQRIERGESSLSVYGSRGAHPPTVLYEAFPAYHHHTEEGESKCPLLRSHHHKEAEGLEGLSQQQRGRGGVPPVSSSVTPAVSVGVGDKDVNSEGEGLPDSPTPPGLATIPLRKGSNGGGGVDGETEGEGEEHARTSAFSSSLSPVSAETAAGSHGEPAGKVEGVQEEKGGHSE